MMAADLRSVFQGRIFTEFRQIRRHYDEHGSLSGCADHQRRLRESLRHINALEPTPERHALERSIEDLIDGMHAADMRLHPNTAVADGQRGTGHPPLNRELLVEHDMNNAAHFSAKRIHSSGSKGRPKINIQRDQLEFFISKGYSGAKIARHFKVSTSYIYKRLKAEGLQTSRRFTPIAPNELNETVRGLTIDFPNAGFRMMAGLLRSHGLNIQRERVRTALRTVDPEKTALRWAQTIPRRVYRVAAPNSLWHIDANLKLARYGMVIHGAIDGNSRLIPYMKCLNNKRASSVFDLFVRSTEKYGIPSRVRSDHGLENFGVALPMNIVRGTERASHITGQSVHNQRIERLWRDVHIQVLLRIKEQFGALIDEGLLILGNECHLKALHAVYLPEINVNLEIFRQAWNEHKMTSDSQQRTPEQQWIDGMLKNEGSGLTSVDSLFQGETLENILQEYGIEHQSYDDNTLLNSPNVPSITPQLATALQSVLDGILDLKSKYNRAVQFFSVIS